MVSCNAKKENVSCISGFYPWQQQYEYRNRVYCVFSHILIHFRLFVNNLFPFSNLQLCFASHWSRMTCIYVNVKTFRLMKCEVTGCTKNHTAIPFSIHFQGKIFQLLCLRLT